MPTLWAIFWHRIANVRKLSLSKILSTHFLYFIFYVTCGHIHNPVLLGGKFKACSETGNPMVQNWTAGNDSHFWMKRHCFRSGNQRRSGPKNLDFFGFKFFFFFHKKKIAAHVITCRSSVHGSLHLKLDRNRKETLPLASTTRISWFVVQKNNSLTGNRL